MTNMTPVQIALCTRMGHPPSSHDQHTQCLCGTKKYKAVKPSFVDRDVTLWRKAWRKP